MVDRLLARKVPQLITMRRNLNSRARAYSMVDKKYFTGNDAATCSVVIPAINHRTFVSEPPKMVGAFEIIEEIGSGGMGVVYRARDTNANRFVALKVIRSGRFSNEEQYERFRREAEAASQLEHPNIARIYSVGFAQGLEYFTMELVDGDDLQSQLERFPINARATARLIRKIALAVEHAHSKGIIHRDIKPRNILIDSVGEPKLVDFGLAKRLDVDKTPTQTNQLLGTIPYMAPEQIDSAKHAGPQADVYGLGATMYYCLTGKSPIEGEDLMSQLQHLRETLPTPPRLFRPEIDSDLEHICLRCLQKAPEDRYATAAELASELHRYLEGEPLDKSPLSLWLSLNRQLKRDEIANSSAEILSATAASWVAALTVLFHSLVFLTVWLKIGNPALWTLLGIWFIATNIVNYTYHWSQYWRLSLMERQSGIMQAAVNASFVCLFFIYGPLSLDMPTSPEEHPFLKIYPPFTLIVAITFVAHANFLGRALLPAFLFFPLSILIAYLPVMGPLIFGIIGGGILAWSAALLKR